MICFKYMVKERFSGIAPQIFGLLKRNMAGIAPPEGPETNDEAAWNKAVGAGLRHDARKIVLIYETESDALIGFFQYYVNQTTFMMEEIQLEPAYRVKYHIFRDLYAFVLSNIQFEPDFVEAFADYRNHKSIGILEKMGLEKIGSVKGKRLYHFRGKYETFLKWFYGEKVEECFHLDERA